MTYAIPFNRPCLVGNEQAYMTQAVVDGHISGDGAFTLKCQRLFEKELGIARALLTTSCTHALEMAALLLDLQPGDEVIVPAFTFVSTVNAFVLRGARPVIVDVRSDTLNLDEARLEQAVTPKTKAIVAVHYAGVGCEMDAMLNLSQHHRIALVEDNAHGLFGRYKGRYLGTLGGLATLSFHETKNFTCGEGGALLINDPRYIAQAEIIREKGTNRSRFFRGEVDKYTWVGLGSSYLPSDILAAFLYAQLEEKEQVQSRRKRVWEYYAVHLKDWAQEHDVRLPFVPSWCEHPYHMFYLVMPTFDQRQRLIAHLRALGILSVFHYQPLHLSEMGRKFGGRPGACPVAESVSDRLLRLPFCTGLRESEQARVIEGIATFKWS